VNKTINKTSKQNTKLFISTAVTQLYNDLNDLGVEVWIDGGWGVDALLGKQSRDHNDLDIVIQKKDIPILRKYMESKGYKDVKRDDTSPWNFVLGDDNGQEVDVHVIIFDKKRNGLYGPVEKGVMYPADSLKGKGIINGQKVKCITVEYMVKFHTGYKLRDNDFNDVTALCEKFGIKLPSEYQLNNH
jgi:lincosamide nucleotidyltransferase A/C/D/E